MGKSKPAKAESDGIREKMLVNWKLLKDFAERLEPVLAAAPRTNTEEDPRRTVQAGGYLALMLFAMLNPVLKTTRAICAGSQLQRVQEEICGQPVSLGSFSEMQHVVDPELLAGLLRSLAGEAVPRFGDMKDREKIGELVAVDGTLLPALPRMAWAIWQNPLNRAGKLHLEFNVWRQIPVEFTVTNGNGNERAVWKSKLKAGTCYVNDRGYSHDYRVIKEVQKVGARYVLRLYNNSLITHLGEARVLSQADREAGVVEDVNVRLGSDDDGPQGRLVRVEKDGHTFLLFTNLEDIEADLVSLIYRCRWQIELFFKWIKCVLGCRHWLAESQAGVTIQVYCALIASVLLVLWTGSRPTKRQWETLQLYWMGWVTLEELEVRLLPRKKS